MVTLHCVATSPAAVHLWQTAGETESLHYRTQMSSSLWNFTIAEEQLSHCKQCVPRLSSSVSHAQVNSSTELSHATKATKATLDKFLPCSSAGHTHTHTTRTHTRTKRTRERERERDKSAIDQSFTFWWKLWVKKRFLCSNKFCSLLLPVSSLCDIQTDGTLREWKPLILYVGPTCKRSIILDLVCVCVVIQAM